MLRTPPPLLLAALLMALGCGDSGGPGGQLVTSGETGDDPTLDTSSHDDASSGQDTPMELDAHGGDTTTADVGPSSNDDVDGAGAADGSAPDAADPADATEPGPDPAEALFGIDHLFEVEVTLDPDDWDALRAETRDFLDLLVGEDCLDQPFEKPWTVFPADVSIDGVMLFDVGIRKKGFLGSLSDVRPSLKIKTDEYDADQEHLGLHRITLNNNQQDPSNLNACLTYRRFAAAGHPAPRCGFARVTVNGQDLGVYTHVESVKKRMLRRHFDDDEGNLYEGTLSDFRPSRQKTFEKKTHKAEADFSDIQAAVDALADTSDGWLAGVEAVFDVDSFLTFWALEVMTGHWDGHTGSNNNNYFVYADPADDGRFTFMPWGADATFRSNFIFGDGAPYPPSVMAASALSHRLYNHAPTRLAYQERLVELLDSIWDEAALLAEVDQMEAVVLPAMPAGFASYMTDDLPRIRFYIEGLRAAVLKDMEGGGPTWDQPLPETFCWVEQGGAELTFTTTWGTLGSPNPFQTGSGQVTSWIDGDQPVQIDQVGAQAGIETEGENAGRALVVLLGMHPDGVIEYLWMAFPSPSQVTTGSTVEIDFAQAEGYRFELHPPYDQQAVFKGYLVGGEVTFSQATPIPGATISGALTTPFYAPP